MTDPGLRAISALGLVALGLGGLDEALDGELVEPVVLDQGVELHEHQRLIVLGQRFLEIALSGGCQCFLEPLHGEGLVEFWHAAQYRRTHDATGAIPKCGLLPHR